MHFLGSLPPQLQAELRRKVDEQTGILKIMTVFPAYYGYRSHPTYEQFVPFCYAAGAQGYSLTSLYHIFCAGTIPPDLDALIREHAEHWRPAGEIVESTTEQALLTGGGSDE